MKKIIMCLVVLVILILSTILFFTLRNCGKEELLTVTFDSCGGSNIESVKIEYDQKVGKPSDPNKIGYTFDNWYTSKTDFSEVNKWSFVETTIQNDIILYAKWNINTYSITFENLLDGTNPNVEIINYTIESVDIIFQLPTRVGYIGSWNLPKIENGTVGDKIIKAQWTAKDIKISFDKTGGEGIATEITRKFDTEYGALPELTRIGYDFGGWWTGENGTGTKVLETTVVKTETAHTLYAKWSAIKIIVSFDKQGGVGTANNKNVIYDSGFGNLPLLTRIGYIFDGWWTNENGVGEQITDETIVKTTTNITLYAKWINMYESGIGSEANPFEIKTASHLFNFASAVNSGNNHLNIYFILAANINLNNIEWTPIGINQINYFGGQFDGKGFHISNFKITIATDAAGFFGYNRGTIKNLGLENIDIFGTFTNAGGLVGYNQSGIITNCYTTGNVSNSKLDRITSAGGLVGYDNNGTISNSFSACNVKIENTTSVITSIPQYNASSGGLIGVCEESTITNCLALGDVRVITTRSGGNVKTLVGRIFGAYVTDYFITNSYYYSGQSFSRIGYDANSTLPSNSFGISCNLTEINSQSFYIVNLKWDSDIWNLSGLDFGNGIYPKLKN